MRNTNAIANAYCDSDADCNRHRHCHCDTNRHSHSYAYAHTGPDTEGYANTKASPDTAASSVGWVTT